MLLLIAFREVNQAKRGIFWDLFNALQILKLEQSFLSTISLSTPIHFCEWNGKYCLLIVSPVQIQPLCQ